MKKYIHDMYIYKSTLFRIYDLFISLYGLIKLGLFEDDSEIENCLAEASMVRFPKQ